MLLNEKGNSFPKAFPADSAVSMTRNRPPAHTAAAMKAGKRRSWYLLLAFSMVRGGLRQQKKTNKKTGDWLLSNNEECLPWWDLEYVKY